MSSNRNPQAGSWSETVVEPLDLAFRADALRRVVRAAAAGQSPYTHQQIADWCERFALARRGDAKVDCNLSVEVAEDIGAQWHLRLVNTHSLVELRALDFASQTVPVEWFESWDRQLTQGAV